MPVKSLDQHIGKTFGFLTVLAVRRGGNRSKFVCLCSCGEQITAIASNVVGEKTRSCGCLKFQPRVDEDRLAVRQVISSYRAGAKKRGLEWQLSEEAVANLIFSPCYYCGDQRATAVVLRARRVAERNGIDRIDNDKGYVLSNVVPACERCNFAKRDMTVTEFTSWLVRASKHLEENGLLNG
jgi:hypothetical protein